jgi:DNA polymerase-1
VGANILGFDLPVLARHHGLGLEETWGRVRDVQLQAMIADPPTSIETTPGPHFKSYSLDAVSERVLGEPKDIRGKALVAEFCTTPRCAHGRSSQCNGWSNIPQSDFRYRAYCVDDQNRAVRIHNALPWTPYMKREMKVQAIMSQITLNGFRVDTDLLCDRIKEGEIRKAEAVLELKERFGMPTERVVHLKTKTRTEIFKSPLATKEGRAWLEAIFSEHGVKNPPKTDKGALATGAEVLKEISTHPKCPAELKKILDLMGIVTSERTIYGTIRDHLVGDRVHPSIWPRQASGRWSITDPGLTVVGKSGKLSHEREVFLSDPGEVIITIDLGQIDARIVAVHAQDENYLAQFAPGEDLHDNIAIQIFGSKAFRQDAKALGHGANYGMGESRMIKDGHDPIRVRAFFRGREQMFPGLIDWTNQVRKAGEAGELLDNGFGRMLRVHPRFAYTQAPAQIGQGGTRDMLAECLLDLVKAEPRVLSMLRAVVHDEIVLSVPKEEAEEISRFVVRTFERDWAPPGKSIPVRVIADSGKPGKNWADAYAK